MISKKISLRLMEPTQLQLTKLNALMPDDPESVSVWLSPRQLTQLER